MYTRCRYDIVRSIFNILTEAIKIIGRKPYEQIRLFSLLYIACFPWKLKVFYISNILDEKYMKPLLQIILFSTESKGASYSQMYWERQFFSFRHWIYSSFTHFISQTQRKPDKESQNFSTDFKNDCFCLRPQFQNRLKYKLSILLSINLK